MLKYFFPAEEDFFKLFKSMTVELVTSAEQFHLMLDDLDNAGEYLTRISHSEQISDEMEDLTLQKLHKTFITPFDRDDIHRLVNKLDDSVDFIDRTARRLVIYNMTSLPAQILQSSALCLKATETIQEAVGFLNTLKNAAEILERCDKIKALEDKAEELILAGVSELFMEEKDIRKLLQIKEIYENMRSIITSCRTVAIVLKDIVLEYA